MWNQREDGWDWNLPERLFLRVSLLFLWVAQILSFLRFQSLSLKKSLLWNLRDYDKITCWLNSFFLLFVFCEPTWRPSYDRELWTQEPFLISTFWFLGFNLQFTHLFSFSFPGASTIRYLFLFLMRLAVNVPFFLGGSRLTPNIFWSRR